MTTYPTPPPMPNVVTSDGDTIPAFGEPKPHWSHFNGGDLPLGAHAGSKELRSAALAASQCIDGGRQRSPRVLAAMLELELMERLAELGSKMDSLKDRIDDCHNGICDLGESRRRGSKGRSGTKRKGSKELAAPDRGPSKQDPSLADVEVTPCIIAADEQATPSQDGTDRRGHVEAPSRTSSKPARWLEEAPSQLNDTQQDGFGQRPSTVRSFCSEDVPKMKHELSLMLDDPEHNKWAKAYATGMPCFICVSVMLTVLQTFDGRPLSGVGAAVIEVTAETVFLLDLIVRFVVAKEKVCFLWNFHNVVDMLAALPLVIRIRLGCVLSEEEMETLPGSALLYVVPVLRLLKTLRGFKCFNLILTSVLKVYSETWPTILVLVFVVLLFSSLIYYTEPRDNIGSYPKAMWFVIVTMTTVGYGDVSPTTPMGYIVSGVLVCSTMFVMALPLGIIGTAVAEIWNERHTILLRTWARERLAQWGYTAKDITSFFEAFDTDGSGELDYSEFCEMLDQMKVPMKEDKRRQLFNSFDGDRSGTIDGDEFICKLWPQEDRASLGSVGEEATKNQRKKLTEALQNRNAKPQQPCDVQQQLGKNDGSKADVVIDTAEDPGMPGAPLDEPRQVS